MFERLAKWYLAPLLLLLAFWCGKFIQESSFTVRDEPCYSLFDDAMISMAYAKNLTQGHGLNWAKFGEPVEGFTSPLWVACMVPFQWMPVPWSHVSLLFSAFCALVIGLNVVVLDRLLSRRLGVTGLLPRMAATFTLAFLYPLNYWSLSGMECGPQVLVFLLGLERMLAYEQGGKAKALWQLGAVLAAALLLRMDMVFYVGIMVAFLLPGLARDWRAALKFLAIVGTPMALYLVFRLAYFHDIFPNTYYLKLHKIPLDIRIARGWFYFKDWAEPLWLVFVLMVAALVVLRRKRAAWLCFVLVLVHLAYNMYAGGDAWEGYGPSSNRFTAVTFPWMIVLIAWGLHEFGRQFSGRIGAVVANVLPALSSLLIFVLVNGLLFVPLTKKNWDIISLETPPFNTEYQKWNVEKAMDLNDMFGTANRVAVVQAGDIGYFCHAELVDIMGYNDAVISKGEPYWDLHAHPIEWYHPGHSKLNYRHLVEDLRPDCFADKWLKFNPAVDAEFYALMAEAGYEEQPNGSYLLRDFVRRDRE